MLLSIFFVQGGNGFETAFFGCFNSRSSRVCVSLILIVFASFCDFKAFQGTFPSFSLSQYRAFINDTSQHRQFANSVKITIASLLVKLLLSCLVSVSLLSAKRSFQKGVCFLLLVALILPFQSYMVPLFKLSKWTNLYDKQLSVILFEAFSPLAPLILFALSKAFRMNRFRQLCSTQALRPSYF